MHIKKKNSIYALIIFFLVISIGLGYSLISTSLSITGGISVAKKRNVYFNNLVVKNGSVTADESPVIIKNSTETTFTITLTSISDYYEFNLDILNDSDKDMMLKEIIKTGLTDEQNSLFDYIVTYSDGEEINVKDSLLPGCNDNINVIIKFKDNLSSITSQTLNLTLNLVYAEDDGSGSVREKFIYKMMANNSTMDNVVSEYVTSSTGIDFSSASSTTNGQGIYTRSVTENNEFPIYYYRGNVTNNNVAFANFCWKIVRTTETGGTKLIYNGLLAEDGSCNNTGELSQLSTTSAYNLQCSSPSDVGYMTGTSYLSNSYHFDARDELIYRYSTYSSKQYYYGDSVIYEDGVYKLQNAEAKTWSSNNINSLIEHYTCRSETDTSCEKVYYIIGGDVNHEFPLVPLGEQVSASNHPDMEQYLVHLENGQAIDDKDIVLGLELVDNADGTYSLNDTITITRKEWYSNFRSYNYSKYHMCPDLHSVTCEKPRYIIDASDRDVESLLALNIVYGNDINWDGEKYTLTDTYTSNNWIGAQNNIASKYHYTCLNTNNICEEVYYIYSYSYGGISYLTLKEGKDIETAETEMFTNNTDSAIKTVLDNWYQENMIAYTEKIENTIWCNDRIISSGALKSKDENSARKYNTAFGAYERKVETKKPTTTCPNQNDSFTLRIDSGGTDGYGNNTLKYPVGLLTTDEIMMAGEGTESYIYTGTSWWTMSPATTNNNYVKNKNLTSSSLTTNNGVRPSISLKKDIKIYSGTGTTDNPFIVK